MKRIDQALAGRPFKVDETACYAAAAAIKAYRASITNLPWAKHSKKTQLAFKLLFISICHKINWDFLQGRLASRFLVSNSKDLLSKAKSITTRDVNTIIGDYHSPERVRASERASMLRNTAAAIEEHFDCDTWNIYLRSKHRINGDDGFIALLNKIPAFSEDPLRKKSNVLVQDLVREKILSFADTNDVAPAIDYHLIRIYLRSGRVVPKEPVVFEALRTAVGTERMRLQSILREEVAQALRYTAFYSGISVPEVNYIDWQIGRSRCHPEEPNCDGPWPDVDVDPDVQALENKGCPYAGFCASYGDPEYRKMQEPVLKKNFY